MPMAGSPGKLERMRSFSLLLSSSLFCLPFIFPPLFPLSTGLAHLGQVGCPLCHMSLPHWFFLDFPHPLIQNLGFPSSQVVTHVPHEFHLDFGLTCSLFDTWLIVSHPNKCQVSLVTLDASKNVKFQLFQNLTKFDRVTKFRETIPTMKSVSSPDI